MNRDFGLLYPLWTDSQRPAELLDRAVGEVGLEHLTIPVVTGPCAQFRFNPAQPPNLFVTEGGWHFPPQAESYTRSAVRPRAARWLGKRNLLAQVCEYAAKCDIAVIFRLEPRAALSLLEHEPQLRSRNAWGDEVIAAGACVLNPALRELLQATLDDLARYAPAGFELTDWLPDLPVDRNRPRPLSWLPAARQLLDVCFCPACRQVAALSGIDADHVARSVRVHLQRTLRDPGNPAQAVGALDDELLSAYCRVRLEATEAWLRRLAESWPTQRRYLLSDARRPQTILDLLPLAHSSAFGLLVRAPDPIEPTQRDEAADPRLWLDGACGAALPVWCPQVRQADQLVRLVTELTRAGAAFLDFEKLEEAPPEALNWLRQAVRFARRD